MNSVIRKNGAGCLEVYQANLEARIQQGEWDLVCRDGELCKEIELCLSECSPQNIHSQLGLDTLSVIEASLQASHNTLGQNRLDRLIKAFEVLELAALNLYLCPWRKEYRVVKMFSGMFTHCVKPALTTQQAKELFALLGYQPASSSEAQELRLSTKSIPSHTLLQLACGFFTARIECQLLLTALASLGGSAERLLHLIHERQHGCSFQIALDSAKRKLEPAVCHSPLALDANLDLYTDKNLAEHDDMASPPSHLYIPPSEDPLIHKMSDSNTSQSNNAKTSHAVSISSLTCQVSAAPQTTGSSIKLCDNERQFSSLTDAHLSASKQGHYACSCLKSCDLFPKKCLQCGEIHNVDCPNYKGCIEKGHELQYRTDALSTTGQDQIHHRKKAAKDDLKQHSCINKSSKDFFFVCHDCHYIHDLNCNDLLKCFSIKHNVKCTGPLQPAQVERVVTACTCCTVQGSDSVVCHTCNTSHSMLCDELETCQMSGHNTSYLLANKEKATQATPMPFHQCCVDIKPTYVCYTCRLFHSGSCQYNQCQRQHEVQKLTDVCSTCADSEAYVLCRYCGTQHCKNCWFKSPLTCKCGMPFIDSPV